MKLQLDRTKEYGLVLEGGGAKGAYQVGAWKALKEENIKIKGVSGVSVGALNGAMICMDDLEMAEQIWENISYSQIMDVSDEQMELLVKGDIKNINFNEVIQEASKLFRDRGLDITPLKKMIAELCDEQKIRQSEREFFIVTYSLSDRQLIDVNARDIPEGLIPDMLLASSYLPVFKRERLHGKHYMDGGGWDRVPLDSLIQRGYEDIIVLRIFGWGVEKPVKIPENVQVINIAPRQELGGMLEFERARSRKNMMLGYYDAKRILYGLQGEDYYLDMELTEEEAYARLVSMARQYLRMEEARKLTEGPGKLEGIARKLEEVPKKLEEVPKILEDVPKKLEQRIEKTLEKLTEKKSPLRQIHEDLLPELAKKLLKNRNWNYADLYVKLMEHVALGYEIPCFAIYTEEEMLGHLTTARKSFIEQQKALPEYASFFE